LYPELKSPIIIVVSSEHETDPNPTLIYKTILKNGINKGEMYQVWELSDESLVITATGKWKQPGDVKNFFDTDSWKARTSFELVPDPDGSPVFVRLAKK
jgi:hypothetical protein